MSAIARSPAHENESTTASAFEVADFSMLGGARIMSSAADAERSARLISWLCALISQRDPKC